MVTRTFESGDPDPGNVEDARTLLAEARAKGGGCPHRVVAYADGRTARCRKTAGHEGQCE